jgi:hypothetical protein
VAKDAKFCPLSMSCHRGLLCSELCMRSFRADRCCRLWSGSRGGLRAAGRNCFPSSFIALPKASPVTETSLHDLWG